MNAIIYPKPTPGPVGVPAVFVEHVAALPRRLQVAIKRAVRVDWA
jgi:hypothetical protein